MPKERNKADGYREKAYEGDTKAMNNLGVCHERGTGVKVNLEMAFEWYMKAADKGDMQSQVNVANAYYLSNGTETDHHKAFLWYREAANGGDAQTQFATGWFLIDGVLKFQTLVDYFGSYALVEVTLLLLVILPTLAIYKFTKEHKTESK